MVPIVAGSAVAILSYEHILSMQDSKRERHDGRVTELCAWDAGSVPRASYCLLLWGKLWNFPVKLLLVGGLGLRTWF